METVKEVEKETKVETKTEKEKINIKKYYLYFMMYAMIGWLYEVFIEFFIFKHGFVNRGTLFGCYCPVYGFGALAFLFTMYPLIKGKSRDYKIFFIPIIFLGCMIVATVIELITSYLCEYFIGSIPWDYSIYKYNFQERIALSTSVRFGIGGVIFLYLLQPLFEKLLNKLKPKSLNIITAIVAVIFVLDILHTFL